MIKRLRLSLSCTLAMCTSCTTPDTTDPNGFTPSGNDPPPDQATLRGLWVWNGSIPGDKAATEELINFATDHAITTLFLDCSPVGYAQDGAEERYTDFVHDAHEAGLEVHGMSGYPVFTVPCGAGLPQQNTCFDEGWGLYETCAASTVGFDAIMDDSEPYTYDTSSWNNDFETRARWHLEYLEGIGERVGSLPVHHATPFWYDSLGTFSREEGGEEKTLDGWIADVVDVVAIMSYRDDVDAIIEVAAGELENGPVWVGIETTELEHAPQATFFDEGPSAVDAALDGLEAQLDGTDNLHGLMVHSYAGWLALTQAASETPRG